MSALTNMIQAGHPIRTFYNSGVYHAEYEWFGQPGLSDWASVRGKRIGITTFGAQTHWFTRHALRQHGLDVERDVSLVQVGGSPTAYQALKAGRIDVAILAAPFKWKAATEGFSRLGDEATAVGKEWVRNAYLAKQGFLDENPATILALLRAHVRAIRLVRADRELAVQTLMRALKYERGDAERAYAEVVPGLHERGDLPAGGMRTFWDLAIAAGEVNAPWPESRFLDRRWIDTFETWAPR
jgi:NitT/TauT family transport system substrate-binding protein